MSLILYNNYEYSTFFLPHKWSCRIIAQKKYYYLWINIELRTSVRYNMLPSHAIPSYDTDIGITFDFIFSFLSFPIRFDPFLVFSFFSFVFFFSLPALILFDLIWFDLIRFDSIRFDSIRFVSFRFVSFRFVSFRFNSSGKGNGNDEGNVTNGAVSYHGYTAPWQSTIIWNYFEMAHSNLLLLRTEQVRRLQFLRDNRSSWN